MKSTFYSTSLFLLLLSCGTNEMEQINNIEAVIDTLQPLETITDSVTEDLDLVLTEEFPAIDVFVTAVLADDREAVVNFISYPLKREAPLPAIMDADEMADYYNFIFDDSLKQKLKAHQLEPDIIDLTSSNGTYGILNGLIWFDHDSKVIAIHYASLSEKQQIVLQSEKIRNSMHPILKDYSHNTFIGRSASHLIRIDETEKGLRMAIWYGDQTMADEPDMILWDGKEEKQGTGGGYQTYFIDFETKYILDDVRLAADENDLGLFFIIEAEGDIELKEEMTEILTPSTAF